MPNQVPTESIRVAHKVPKSTRRVGPGFLLLITQQFDQQYDAWLEVFVKHVVVEAGVADGETGELPRVAVRVPATLDGRRYKPKLEQFFVEEPSVSAQVSDEIADLGPDRCICVHD